MAAGRFNHALADGLVCADDKRHSVVRAVGRVEEDASQMLRSRVSEFAEIDGQKQ